MHHGGSWTTCCHDVLWRFTYVYFWSMSLTKSGKQRLVVAPKLQSVLELKSHWTDWCQNRQRSAENCYVYSHRGWYMVLWRGRQLYSDLTIMANRYLQIKWKRLFIRMICTKYEQWSHFVYVFFISIFASQKQSSTVSLSLNIYISFESQ